MTMVTFAGAALWTALTVSTLGATFNLAQAKEIQNNSVHMANAPDWVTTPRVDKVVDHIQAFLEWNIHRIEVVWHTDEAEFEKVHGLGPSVLAISRQMNNTVHLGPRVTTINFDSILTHELVHVISYQKYHEAIPKWLEEGLANYLGKVGTVNYDYLASHAPPSDVRELTHPFSGGEDHVKYHYMASQALAEMIAKKCDLSNLLRLSVGKSVDQYLSTYCEINDLTATFNKWVAQHATSKGK